MASSTDALNRIAADPEFLKLSPEDQKSVLTHITSSSTTPIPETQHDKEQKLLLTNYLKPTANRDTVIDFARPFVAGGLGDAAATATAPIPIPGSSVAAYGGTYTLADTLMQYLKEKKPDSLGGALGEGVVNAGVGKLLQGAGKFGGRVLGAVRDADQPEILSFKPTTSQALNATGSQKLAGMAKYFEDIATSSKNKALDRTAGAGFSKALDFIGEDDLSTRRLSNLANDYMPMGEGSLTPVKFKDAGRPVTPVKFSGNPRPVTPIKYIDKPVNPSQPLSGQTEVLPGETKNLPATSYTTIAGEEKTLPGGQITIDRGSTKISTDPVDKVLGNPTKLQETLTRSQELGTGSNLRKTLGNYQFAKIFNSGAEYTAEGGVRRINPDTINQMLGDPDMQESYKLLYGSEGFSNVKQFFKNISYVQDKIGAGTYRKLWLMEGGIGIAAGLITGSPILSLGGSGAVGGYLSARTLGTLLNKPSTARIMVNLASGSPLGVSEEYAGKMIMRALHGSTIALVNEDGSKTPYEVTDKGLSPLK